MEDSLHSTNVTIDKADMDKLPRHHLKLKFMVPIVVMMLGIMIAITLLVGYYNSRTQHQSLIHKHLLETKRLATKMLQDDVEFDADALQAVIHTLVRDQHLAKLFKAREQAALLDYTQPLYTKLNSSVDLTHFYFHLPDRTNLLRLHAPELSGGMIDRKTTLMAEKTDRMHFGIEMGELGTLTLRIVYPWHEKESGELLGYIELGKEIDHVVHNLHEAMGLDAYLFLHKEMLDKQKWAEAMALQGKENTWDVLPGIIEKKVVVNTTRPQWKRFYNEKANIYDFATIVRLDKRSYSPVVVPLFDIDHRLIADVVLLVDITFQQAAAQNTLAIALLTVLMSGIPILFFFGRQAKKLQTRLEENERNLELRANTDALTGLATRRVFDERLAEEVNRSARYQHKLSLLLIDIDNFKRINDTYGHQDGDVVLQELAGRLLSLVRTTDLVCRYGGEEIAVILPETDKDMASALADKLNRAVDEEAFLLQGGRVTENITISIGGTTFPDFANSARTLVQAADSLLYKAKHEGRNRVAVV